jgi:basic membrane lipoprotein Med (substrate-binding protein (PBP1-ABC) superfamily)
MPSQAAPPSDANDFATTIMQCYRQITDALASVSDEQSARAAAPILTQATDRLKPAFERLVAAARSGAFSARNTNVEENAKAFYNMKSEIERVYPSPAGQFLKPELRRLLDTLVESAIAGDRTRTEKWIQDHNLNQ